MMHLIKKLPSLHPNSLLALLVFLSLLLGSWVNYIQHGWINSDFVLYSEAARLFSIGAWNEGFSLFKWPLYSLLISGLHKLSGLSIHTSAQALSILLFGLATGSFLKIIQLIGGNQKVILAGALVLFSSGYIVGDVLPMLVRDQGFWAFFLLAIACLIRFRQTHKFWYAVCWQVAIITATLFRIEAISFLILLPLTLILEPSQSLRERFGATIKANSIVLILILAISLLLASGLLPGKYLGRLHEVFTLSLYTELTQKLLDRADIMSSEVLGRFLEDFALEGLLLTFLYVIGSKILTTTGLLNAGMAAMAWRMSPPMLNDDARILKMGLAIAIINMGLIIVKVFVLSGRYVIAFSLLAMIFSAFYLAHALQYLHSTVTWKKNLVVLLLLFLSLSLIKNLLPKRDGHNFEQSAAAWVAQDNVSDQPVFYDNSRVRYYAGAPFVGTWLSNWQQVITAIEQNEIHKYDYLLISIDKDHPDRLVYLKKQLPRFQEVRRFNSPKAKKSIVVFKLKK